MFNETSGSMYEEIENARKKKLHHKKVIKRRATAIVILSLILIYLGLFLFDMHRFKSGQTPFITTGHNIKEYDDGKVETYYSLGWIFRYYDRETIKLDEITTFWSKIKMDDVLIRNSIDPNLPEIEKDYEIPRNVGNKTKVRDVLFFYDENMNLLDTYKCILSESDCDISISAAFDEDPIVHDQYSMSMDVIENRYVFITEYKNKSTAAEEKHIYLYDISAKRIIAEYQDVRYSSYYVDDNNHSHGLIDGTKYMVKKNDLWGIDDVSKGRVVNFEDYKYKYIRYDYDNNLYVLKNTNDEYLALDANRKVYTNSIKENLESVFYKDGKVYFIAYNKATISKKNYFLYNQDGVNVLAKENIEDLKAYDNFLVYTNDGYLFVINYDGQEVISSVKLYLNSSYREAYSVRIVGSTLVISTPQENKRTRLTDEYYYNMSDWSLIKVRNNVSETR